VNKSLMTTIAASVLFSGAAFAGDNESPIKGKGPFQVVQNGGKPSTYTVDEINKALDYFGRPSLGTSRVLHDPKARDHQDDVTIVTRTGDSNAITTYAGKWK
jgi:hypothetical protein